MTDATATTVAPVAAEALDENKNSTPKTTNDNVPNSATKADTTANASANTNTASTTHIEFEPPQACIRRLLKTALPPSTNVAKDASSAFSRASGIFVLYLTTCANDFAREGKRSTIIAKDVLNAVKELGFGEDFGETLEKFLDVHRREEMEKKREKERMKERLSGGTGDGDGGGGNELALEGKGVLRGADGKFTEKAANSRKEGEGGHSEEDCAIPSTVKGTDGQAPEEEPSSKRQKVGNADGDDDSDAENQHQEDDED